MEAKPEATFGNPHPDSTSCKKDTIAANNREMNSNYMLVRFQAPTAMSIKMAVFSDVAL
jgi:hypothetical protein